MKRIIITFVVGGLLFVQLPISRLAAEDASTIDQDNTIRTSLSPVDFNRDIRPILSDKCFFCHGPDEENRKADLRLDVREDAEYVFDSGDFVDRIHNDDRDLVMPPPQTNLTLTEDEKETLAAWIDQGFPYANHWAFTLLPEKIDVPTCENKIWCKQPLDAFVLHQIEAAQMQPSPPTDPLRWLRRVSLDLSGLPPTPDEIADFERSLTQDVDAAFEDVVDRLLESPTFGEHMAVTWLDASRYADSYGYQSDKLNTQWPYRDWVVKAFNDNLPYDEFLTWQLAGDMLDNPTEEQKLATAFNRIHRLNNEGGAVFEEWRIENVADRVHTFGTAVLGLTMECCRCHDHKYDPISMRDYYSLSAFFNSIDESGVYDRTEKVPSPTLLLPTKEQRDALAKSALTLEMLEAQYASVIESAKPRFETWKTSLKDELTSPDLRLALAFDQDFDNAIKDVYHPSESDRSWTKMPELVPVTDSSIPALDPLSASDHRKTDQPIQRRAMKTDGERGVTTKGIEPFDRWKPFSVIVTFKQEKQSPLRSLIVHHTRGTDCGYNGWDLTVVDGHLESRMYRHWPGNAIGVRSVENIKPHQWHQVTATYDGSSRAAGLKLFVGGKPLSTEVLRDKVMKSANVVVDHGGEFVVGQRFRARGLADGLIDDVRVYDRALSMSELESFASGTPIDADFEYYVSAVDDEARAAMQQLTEARHAYVMAEEVMNEIPIMEEMDEPRPTHVLARGQYDAPTSDETLVPRDTFQEFALPFPEDAPRDRLGLAAWVTDPANPLTARVAVNRLWGNFFTEPLVRTPENFGLQGELPTHPELLDYLSRDFISSGWDIKRMCRSIVMSATYQQDSAATPESLEHDPTNRLLARGPAYRLSAEQIRDLTLRASGLLNPDRGGPPVSPYQPGEDLWREANGMSPPYQQSVGEALYRRSLYSVWKRTAPLPNMMAFDTTSREVCTVKRSRTNTPMQALVLLNDIQFVEAARELAEQISSLESDQAKIDSAFVRLTSRHADDQELEVLQQLLDDERKYFLANPDSAKQLTSIGQSEIETSIDAVELAALTTMCQAVLNLDATIWKR
ncbi:DUF1553 domain-containing protein [Rubripirellula amarantea]|nr:DUF1553 domain-containing protein [Rubripirellula amarantea]